MGKLSGTMFVSIFVAMGIVQWFAIMDGFQYWFGISGFLAFLLSGFLSYVPILGTIAGFIGAMNAWGWGFWGASLLFLSPLILILVTLFYAEWSDRS